MLTKLNNIFSALKIKANCVNYKKIRNIGIYDLEIVPGTKIKDIEKFSKELSIYLKSFSEPRINIISNTGTLQLEVVEEKPEKINFVDKLKSITKKDFFLGSSVDGEDVFMDFTKNPHLLIAGTTGSGKSSLLHTIIANCLRFENIETFIIDTKNVEFSKYKNCKNTFIANDVKSSISVLQFIYDEMEFRYKNPGNYNYIILVIDEFADIIMQDDSKIFHSLLCKIAQKSRAAKIHCVISTQRPSVNVISGTIKANFPARISCQVASLVDSKVILDTSGAQNLVGMGDALIKNYNNNLKRFQIAFSDPEEVISYYGNN